jgi:hypothetical protein
MNTVGELGVCVDWEGGGALLTSGGASSTYACREGCMLAVLKGRGNLNERVTKLFERGCRALIHDRAV